MEWATTAVCDRKESATNFILRNHCVRHMAGCHLDRRHFVSQNPHPARWGPQLGMWPPIDHTGCGWAHADLWGGPHRQYRMCGRAV
eukprot:4277423-Lingulodinium_polyedra.AAC.1